MVEHQRALVSADQNARTAPDPRYLTRDELATVSGLSPATIRRYKEKNLIPFFQPGGKGARVLFPRDAIQTAVAYARQDPPKGINAEEQAKPTSSTSRRPTLPEPRPRWQSNPSRNSLSHGLYTAKTVVLSVEDETEWHCRSVRRSRVSDSCARAFVNSAACFGL